MVFPFGNSFCLADLPLCSPHLFVEYCKRGLDHISNEYSDHCYLGSPVGEGAIDFSSMLYLSVFICLPIFLDDLLFYREGQRGS